ncbi:Hypothetical predicted protein [Marmota monax]|uniref:Uncharacterized protein n=1 Tax=Marmota monax TaxID=9995 RepID=A0A5E4C2M8_MARMO|nr:hypothetical protein GHT09_006603 [Marmota monax]VTJ76137.1 Hypothetical predicted protein [Marmota monax]
MGSMYGPQQCGARHASTGPRHTGPAQAGGKQGQHQGEPRCANLSLHGGLIQASADAHHKSPDTTAAPDPGHAHPTLSTHFNLLESSD